MSLATAPTIVILTVKLFKEQHVPMNKHCYIRDMQSDFSEKPCGRCLVYVYLIRYDLHRTLVADAAHKHQVVAIIDRDHFPHDRVLAIIK